MRYHTSIDAGSTEIPARPNSKSRKNGKKKLRVFRPRDRSGPPRIRKERTAIGKRMDAIGMSASRLACLLSTRHGIPATHSGVGHWANGVYSPDKHHYDAICTALSKELGMPVEEVDAAFKLAKQEE